MTRGFSVVLQYRRDTPRIVVSIVLFCQARCVVLSLCTRTCRYRSLLSLCLMDPRFHSFHFFPLRRLQAGAQTMLNVMDHCLYKP